MNKVGGRFVSVFIDRLRPPIFLSVNTQTENHMLVYEIATIKPQLPQTPAQARIAVLKQSAQRAQTAVKAERKRQQVQAAQQKLQKTISAAL